MNNNKELLNSFNKVMDDDRCKKYRGCLLWKSGNQYRIFNHKVKSLKEVDSIIDRSLQVMEKSLKKNLD